MKIEESGVSQADWLRECILSRFGTSFTSPREPSATVLLEEIMEVRILLLNLFQAAIPAYPSEAVAVAMAYAQGIKREKALEVLRLSDEKVQAICPVA